MTHAELPNNCPLTYGVRNTTILNGELAMTQELGLLPMQSASKGGEREEELSSASKL